MTIDLQLSGVRIDGKKSKPQDPAGVATYEKRKEQFKPQVSLITADEAEYKQALLLEKLRDALLEQTRCLMQDVTEDIHEKSRALAPRVFGWKNESIPGLSSDLRRKKSLQIDQSNYESAWETLRGLETQSYRLEDPGIANDFFSDIQEMLINDELKGVQQKHLNSYPWLRLRSNHIFSHSLLKKKNKKPVALKNESRLPKKTISQIRLEKDLEEKEIELRKIQSTKFQASPIPASSIIPKYQEIIKKHTTKTMEARQKSNYDYIAKLNDSKKIEEENSRHKIFVAREASLPVHVGSKSKSTTTRQKRVTNTDDECTFQPKISQKIPDFKKTQESFERILENGRNEKSTTIPVPFAMLSRVKKIKTPTVFYEKEKKLKPSLSPTNEQNHIVVPKSTRTTILKLQHLAEQKEAEKLVQELEMEQNRIAEEKKRAVAERIRMKLAKTSVEDVEKERSDKSKKHQEYQKGLEKSYMETKEQMKQRINSRRCLFERVQLEAARNQARSKVNMVLKSAGVLIQDL